MSPQFYTGRRGCALHACVVLDSKVSEHRELVGATPLRQSLHLQHMRRD
jgi:hypothetical protein